jgi:hypothetical protein
MNETEFYSMAESRNDLSFSHLSRSQTNEVSHSYHKYPAKFIPHLARALIKDYTNEKDFIWDPFCGSGTLNVEAFRNKRHSIGTDTNPIAILISRVKTTPLEPKALSEYKEELLEVIHTHTIRAEGFYRAQNVLNGGLDILKKWYSADSLRELGHILWCIKGKEGKKKFSEFALCAFSSILKRSSYWLNSSIKAQIDPDKKPERPLFYFERQLQAMGKANKIFYEETKGNNTTVAIFKHNAKVRLPPRMNVVDCIITSPPYLVSYDYSDIFRLSNYFLFPQKDYAQFRKAFIGTPLQKNGRSCSKAIASGQQIINSISERRIRRTLTEYYKDMSMFFGSAQYHLRKNGRLIMIVGDTTLRGIKIPNAYLLTEIGDCIGWLLEKTYVREIPVKILPTLRDAKNGRFTNKYNQNRSKRYNKEYVLIFRRRIK